MNNQAPDIAWFNDAKFGIFIHWGIHAVGQYPESWSFDNHGSAGHDPRDTLPHAGYMALWYAAEYLSVALDTPTGYPGYRYSVASAGGAVTQN